MAITESRDTLIEATPEEIMEVFFDLESLAEWSPVHSEAEVLERDEEGRPKLSRQVVKIVGIRDEQVLDYSTHEDGVSWTLVSSKQLRAQEGRYTLAPEGDKTRVTVELMVEFNVPLPGFVVKKGTQVLLDAATNGLRKRVLDMQGR
jgi:ribosome-associated toxin RatA of RatAB toxin-antitoxin module